MNDLAEAPTREELEAAHCWVPGTDVIAGQPAVTAFRQRARLHQARWREHRGYPIGHQPMDGKGDARGLGSRIELGFAERELVNLISDRARRAAAHRLATPQPHQTLSAQRLWADLLSSMPMCFNLFGPLADDLDLARQIIPSWFPDAPGTPVAVHLEWSPGRRDPAYLNNRTAFDAAIELDLGDGTFGILGIETKYHEHAIVEKAPDAETRLPRYQQVTDRSGAFAPDAVGVIVGKPLQQIWQDHLLALSMQQHPSGRWAWAKFVIVHPARNPSFSDVAEQYRNLLADDTTFGTVTLDALLRPDSALPAELREPLHERYVW